jgi:GNAT acetyltransferase
MTFSRLTPVPPGGCPAARARAMWEGLAGVPVAFSPVVRVEVAAQSRVGRPGWVGIVVIEDAALVTAPTARVAQTVQQALGTVPVASLADAGVLGARLPVAEMLGPASLAYLDAGEFRPQDGRAPGEPRPPRGPAAAEPVALADPELRAFLAAAREEDLGESGLAEITSPAFAVREHGRVVAAVGYRDWPGGVAHLSVLTGAQARGRGLARVAASAAVMQAIHNGKLPQWRARPEASRRVARALGFRELGSQVSLSIDLAPPAAGGGRAGPLTA